MLWRLSHAGFQTIFNMVTGNMVEGLQLTPAELKSMTSYRDHRYCACATSSGGTNSATLPTPSSASRSESCLVTCSRHLCLTELQLPERCPGRYLDRSGCMPSLTALRAGDAKSAAILQAASTQACHTYTVSCTAGQTHPVAPAQ